MTGLMALITPPALVVRCRERRGERPAPGGNNLQGFKDFYQESKALTVFYVPNSLDSGPTSCGGALPGTTCCGNMRLCQRQQAPSSNPRQQTHQASSNPSGGSLPGTTWCRETDILLLNNQRQHAAKDVLPLRICANYCASCQPLLRAVDLVQASGVGEPELLGDL